MKLRHRAWVTAAGLPTGSTRRSELLWPSGKASHSYPTLWEDPSFESGWEQFCFAPCYPSSSNLSRIFLVRWTKAAGSQSNLVEQRETSWHECPDPRHKFDSLWKYSGGTIYRLWIFVQFCKQLFNILWQLYIVVICSYISSHRLQPVYVRALHSGWRNPPGRLPPLKWHHTILPVLSNQNVT